MPRVTLPRAAPLGVAAALLLSALPLALPQAEAAPDCNLTNPQTAHVEVLSPQMQLVAGVGPSVTVHVCMVGQYTVRMIAAATNEVIDEKFHDSDLETSFNCLPRGGGFGHTDITDKMTLPGTLWAGHVNFEVEVHRWCGGSRPASNFAIKPGILITSFQPSSGDPGITVGPIRIGGGSVQIAPLGPLVQPITGPALGAADQQCEQARPIAEPAVAFAAATSPGPVRALLMPAIQRSLACDAEGPLVEPILDIALHGKGQACDGAKALLEQFEFSGPLGPVWDKVQEGCPRGAPIPDYPEVVDDACDTGAAALGPSLGVLGSNDATGPWVAPVQGSLDQGCTAGPLVEPVLQVGTMGCGAAAPTHGAARDCMLVLVLAGALMR